MTTNRCLSYHLFLVYGDEVCRSEPFVASYVVDAVLKVTEALREIHLKEVA